MLTTSGLFPMTVVLRDGNTFSRAVSHWWVDVVQHMILTILIPVMPTLMEVSIIQATLH